VIETVERGGVLEYQTNVGNEFISVVIREQWRKCLLKGDGDWAESCKADESVDAMCRSSGTGSGGGG
jgi:hypothetical protein